jgi:hypothetical protein
LKTVTGHITTAGAAAITVIDSNGAATNVQISSMTRVTRITSVPATSLSNGTAVLVLTDTNATVAQRISVLESTGGAGGPGNGSGRFSGTPAAGRNPSCFQRGGQGGGSGQGNGFQGLRGTVESVTSSRLVFDDSQGQTYSVAITATTAIQRTDQAKVSDLAAGMAVMATGTASSKGLAARTITIQG